jgi:predicted O-methyltransferase YrrM
VGVEVGTQRGKYAIVLATKIPKARLFCVDPWEAYSSIGTRRQNERYALALKNLAPFLETGQVVIYRERSMDALIHFSDESLDYVFIDGDHTFDHCCPDIIFWSQKVRSGGMIAVHDYYHFRWAGVVEAVDAYTKCHKIDPWFVTREREATAFWVKP